MSWCLEWSFYVTHSPNYWLTQLRRCPLHLRVWCLLKVLLPWVFRPGCFSVYVRCFSSLSAFLWWFLAIPFRPPPPWNTALHQVSCSFKVMMSWSSKRPGEDWWSNSVCGGWGLLCAPQLPRTQDFGGLTLCPSRFQLWFENAQVKSMVRNSDWGMEKIFQKYGNTPGQGENAGPIPQYLGL